MKSLNSSKRHRVIILGIRSDHKHKDEYLIKRPQTTLESVIGQLPQIRSGLNREFIKYHKTDKYANGKPKVYKNLKDTDKNWEKYLNKHIKKITEWGNISLNGLSNSNKLFKNGTGSEFIKTVKKTFSETAPKMVH